MAEKEEKKEVTIEDVAVESATNIRLQFNAYAIEKYGVSNKKLVEFYQKYDQAVDYYSVKEKGKVNRNLVFLALSGVAAGVCITLVNVTEAYDLVAGLTGIGFGFLGTVSAAKIAGMKEEEEYKLNKKNPHIKPGTIDEKLAIEYSKMKKLINKKA